MTLDDKGDGPGRTDLAGPFKTVPEKVLRPVHQTFETGREGMTVAVGSIIATTVLSSSVSMLQGIVGLVAVYLLQMGAALARRNKTVHNLKDNSPYTNL